MIFYPSVRALSCGYSFLTLSILLYEILVRHKNPQKLGPSEAGCELQLSLERRTSHIDHSWRVALGLSAPVAFSFHL